MSRWSPFSPPWRPSLGRAGSEEAQAQLDRARSSAGGLRLIQATALAVAGRPDLWLTGLRTARSLVARQWWRHPPFLPLPDRRWLHFRLMTAYGGNGAGPTDAHDVITWLEWCRRFPT